MTDASTQSRGFTPAAPGVSRLAAKVAHELNNPLDAVLRFVSLAQRKVESGNYADLQRHLADAQFGLERMHEILRDLMEIGRETHDFLEGRKSAARRLLPQELIAAAVRTVTAQAEQKRVRIVTSDQWDGTAMPTYDVRVSQIVANVLKNAVEASPEGSAVHIVVERAAGVEKHLRLMVLDNGPGMVAAVLSDLFSPFVTTKEKGAGHGLGLAISRELAVSLNGALTVENRAGGGCVATLLLPA